MSSSKHETKKFPEDLDILVTDSKTSQSNNSDKEVIGGENLRMQEFSLPMSPGEGLFVTNKGVGVGTFGDGPVDAHDDAEEPDEKRQAWCRAIHKVGFRKAR